MANQPENNNGLQVQPQDLLAKLATERGSPALLLNGEFHVGHEEPVLDLIRSHREDLASHEKICVVVHSPGGQLEPFFRMLKAIRIYAAHVEVMVPRWAKSAATFFCLGANEIHMGTFGELGPLDPQRYDPSGAARPISPLDTLTAVNELKGYSSEVAVELMDSMVLTLLERSHMDIPYAIERASQIVPSVVGAIYSRVDIHELGDVSRVLSVSEHYAELVMERWSYPDIDASTRKEIVTRLVRGYPTHGFLIDLEQAQAIGLRARQLEEDTEELCRLILAIVDDGQRSMLAFPTTMETNQHDVEYQEQEVAK